MAHCIFQPAGNAEPGQLIKVFGPEAHHAIRVKRLGAGDAVHVLDGTGTRLQCRIESTHKSRQGEWELVLRVEIATKEPRTKPHVRVLTGVPKGEALEQMIDGLSQVGARSWGPLACARSVVDPREGKLARLQRVAEESLKQCSRSWLLELEQGETLQHAIASSPQQVVLADAAGEKYDPLGEDITLLIGPEGGFAPDEIAAARAAGVRVCRFGVHVMRIEVAAVTACASIINAGTLAS
jgi:16S rRNA (uracil1498-N3)-methyltransferase